MATREQLDSDAYLAMDNLEACLHRSVSQQSSSSSSPPQKVPLSTEIANWCAKAYIRAVYITSIGTYWTLEESVVDEIIQENLGFVDSINQRMAELMKIVDCAELQIFINTGFRERILERMKDTFK
jgi:hypothetical protein